MKISKLFVLRLAASALLLAPAMPAVAQTDPEPAATNTPMLEQQTNTDSNAASSPTDAGSNWKSGQPIVQIGEDVVLKSGEEAEAVVVVGGSAAIHGRVRQSVVVIGGNLVLDGSVGDAAVAVMGNISMESGASVRHDAVAVLGNLALAPGAKIGQNAVSVGGRLAVADGASVGGQKVSVANVLPGIRFEHFSRFLRYCVLEMRPLAFQVHWVWVVSGMFFLFYLVVALVFPKPVQVCVEGLTRRPATTFLLGLLSTMLVPVVLFILAVTGIGLLVVPFLIAALLFGVFVGKTALLEWLGYHVLRPFGAGAPRPLIAFVVGWILITLLYVVPILGLLTFAMATVWSLGCAVAAAFSSFRRELPEKPAPPAAPPSGGFPVPPAPFTPGSTAAPQAGSAVNLESGAPETGNPLPPGSPGFASAPPTLSKPVTPPVYPLALSLPKASFWERMAAAFLDLIVIGLFSLFIHFPLLVALAYFVGMWLWKGTTVGGVVLKLQVVRIDGDKITFPVALIRSLAAALSVVVLFLGFLWIAWDPEKQGWHDKIAGTVVVRLPQSVPLLCL